MAIIGFALSKIDVRKEKGNATGGIEVKHNLSITNVEKTTLDVGGAKNEVLKIDFSFDILYGSQIGKISLGGDLIYTDTKEIVSETEKSWKESKELNKTVREPINKFIYNKGIVKAIELSDSVNLPQPIPLPKLNFGSESKK